MCAGVDRGKLLIYHSRFKLASIVYMTIVIGGFTSNFVEWYSGFMNISPEESLDALESF